MWNVPNGFFETLFALAALGAFAGFAALVYVIYFVASNITIVWG